MPPWTRMHPKGMSLTAAQRRMLITKQGNDLFEDLPGTPSMHILKPKAVSSAYPPS